MLAHVSDTSASGDKGQTKERVLDCATELFALRGYGMVSVSDIALAAGIQKSTLYHHYPSKEALLEDIMARFERNYRNYFTWLTIANSRANTLEEVMDNVFNKDFVEMNDAMSCYGMALALKEQRHNKSAYERAYNLLWEHSTSLIKADLDRLIARGIIPESDTNMLAILFMTFLVVINEIKISEFIGDTPPIDTIKQFNDMRRFLTSALEKGV